MIRLLCRDLTLITRITTDLTPLKSLYSTAHRPPSSLTVSYLINSCGLSPTAALDASSKIELKSTKRPDAVLSILKSYGVTAATIARLVASRPRTLSADPDKTVRPKLEFLHRSGFSGTQLSKILSIAPDLFRTSLHKRLVPSVDFLKSIRSTDHDAFPAAALRTAAWFIQSNVKTSIIPNLESLRAAGVPEPKLAKLILLQPRALTRSRCQFNESIKLVERMGVVPSDPLFIYAFAMASTTSKLKWEAKWALCQSFGWSDNEIVMAFQKQPMFMGRSVDKIMGTVNFLVEKLEWSPKSLAGFPVLLGYSLEKTIIPRSRVMLLLKSKGPIEWNPVSCSVFVMSREKFFQKYVLGFHKKCPEVLNAYQANACKKVKKKAKIT